MRPDTWGQSLSDTTLMDVDNDYLAGFLSKKWEHIFSGPYEPSVQDKDLLCLQ